LCGLYFDTSPSDAQMDEFAVIVNTSRSAIITVVNLDIRVGFVENDILAIFNSQVS
jgi:hypothetical protein